MMKKVFTMVLAMVLPIAAWAGDNDLISFADDMVKSLCVDNWDSNHDGELSYKEAAAVTSLGDVFDSNGSINSFNELRYFTGLKSIGDATFRFCTKLKSIVIPDNVKTIGNQAFYTTGLTSIVIPDNVTTIYKYAFSGCANLTSVTLGCGLTSIGELAFNNCAKLTTVKALMRTPVAINENTFINRTNATLYVPQGSKDAYEAADYWKEFKEIEEVVTPNDGSAENPFSCAEANDLVAELVADTPTETEYYVKGKVCAIEENFSYKNGYATFRISDDGTDVGSFYVFHTKYFVSEDYAGGRVPNIGDEVVFCGKLVNHEGTTPETVDNQCRLVSLNNKTVGTDLVAGDLFIAKTAEDVEMAFVAGCPARPGSSTGSTNIGCSVGYAVNGMQTGLPAAIDADYNGNVTIPETVEGLEVRTIAPSAFANTKLKLVNVPATVWDIETDAFSGCTELAGVNLPENVILNPASFKDCTSLTDIKLPAGVQLYGTASLDPIFSGCTGLTAIRVFDEVPYALENKLVDDPSKVTLYVPAGRKGAYVDADYWRDFGEIYEIFTAPIKLNDGTVDAQFRIIDETAKTVETFGTYRLGPAIDKTVEGSITIPAEVNGYQVVGIGSWSFRDCENITHVSLPATITTIGASAFRTCYQLQEVNIPEGVTSIGLYAFKSCIFSSLTLPSSLQTIEEVAFEGCNELTSVTMSGSTPPTIGEYTFNINNPSNVTIYVPLGSLVAYQAADYWNMFNKILELEAEPVSPSFAESTIIPWGTDKAWEMKYMYFDEIGNVPATDGSGHAWTDVDFDDSSWSILTGPIARYRTDFSDVNTLWEKEGSCYYLRRTFELSNVNEAGYYFCSQHDDNVKVWINGTQVVDAGFNGKRQYYHIPASAFVEGTNTLAIYLDDTGGGAYLDYCMANFYLLKNVETGKYLNVGDEYRAVLADEGMPVKLSKQVDGSYTVYFPFGSQNQQLLYRTGEEGVFVDYNVDWAQSGCPQWTFTDAGGGHIYIQSLTTHPTYGQEAMPGTYMGNISTSNSVAGNVTSGHNIIWTVEPLPVRTAAQVAKLGELITTAQGLNLDTNGASTVLNNEQSTYMEMLVAITDLQDRINDENYRINEKLQDLNKLITNANAVGVSTGDAQAVVANPSSMDAVNNAISTLRAAYIDKLGEGVDGSLLPLDVTGVILNPSFVIDNADEWSWNDGVDGPGLGENNMEYRERTFDFHQTISGLPNGNYVLKVKGFHRPGNKDAVYSDFMQEVNNAKAKLYANDESVILKNVAAEAQETEVDGWSGIEVTYNDQKRFIPHEKYDASTWFATGYYENELAVTVTDGTLTLGVRLDESGEEDWVCFDDFRLIYNKDYIINGDMEGNDVSCFYLKEPDDTDPVPSTIVDGVGKDGSRCIVVNSADNPANIWDTQFYVRLTKPLPAGTRYHLKFDYKASQEAEVHTQSQQEPGGYLAMNPLNYLYFKEEWQTYDEHGVISDSQSPADNLQTIAFDLAVSESATTYYFDNFSLEIDNTLPQQMTNIIINSSMEDDDTSCFFFSQKKDNPEEENPAEQSTIVDGVGVDGSRGIVVQSSDNAENDWDTQFFVRLPYSLPAGTLYRLKFNYKASQEARGHSEMHEQPRTYLWEGFGDQDFTTEWQSYETVGMISDNQSPEGNMQTIAFDLNISREAIDYYFDNVTFEVDGNLSIPFADAQVKELCVANWDTNSDGELSVSEAAAVTNEQFADLSFESVTADSWTFDELQYFTGLTVLNTKLAETKISSVKIPVKVTEIGADAFRKTLLTSITLPNAVKRVGERAFSECGELVTANLGRVEEIDVNAFIAAGIVNLTIPGTVKTVGLEPFSWNGTMKQATLEEGVTKVPETMFHGNVNLTTVSLPSTLTTIEQRAFQQCEALTTISIPESVTTIDVQAFNNCTSLVEVTVANPTPVEITEEVFSNRKNATLYVPDGSVAAYRAAEYWKEFKRILVVGTSDPVNETDISQMPNAIYMEPITGRVGRKFWAELKLKNEYDIRAYQFDIELPAGVTIAIDEDGKYIYEQGGRHEDVEPVLNYNEASSTYYMRVIDDVAAGDGVIWKLNLKVAEGLALGDYPVVFTNVKYTPADGQDTQDIPDVTCRLMIEEHGYLKGDANDDDIVNIADVVCIVNHSAHFDTPIFVETSADVTGNGKADLTDAVKIIDYIIGRIDDLTNAPAMARAFKAPAMAPTLRAQSIAPASGLSVEKVSMAYASDVSILENAIYADNLTVKSGQTCPLTIFLKNAKQTNGYQFQLVLPEGVTIPKDDKGKYACELSSRHQGHKVEINYKDGAYKVLVYSQSSEALTGNDGEICTIQLQVADNMVNGDYTLTIKEAAYSLISCASWVSLPKVDIRLSNFVKGDANGNGYVDIYDAVCIVDHIVGKSTPGFIEAAADVNNDNIVDIADAVAIVNFITGKSSALSQ